MIENMRSEKEFEEKRLKQTISLAEEQLKRAKEIAAKKKLEIIDAKKDVYENATHSIANLWNSNNFEALAELSQYANPVTDKIVDYEEEENKIFLLERLKKSPYFARIDFKFDEEDEFEKIYIGRSSLKKDNHQERYVYDWRSPIASVFYRFMTGNTVETVVLLAKLNAKPHIKVELGLDEMDLTAAESKASHEEIKAYVKEQTGLSVSSLYIAQVKEKLGIKERACYNKPTSEDTKQPQCPPEKGTAIVEALRHFGMI